MAFGDPSKGLKSLLIPSNGVLSNIWSSFNISLNSIALFLSCWGVCRSSRFLRFKISSGLFFSFMLGVFSLLFYKLWVLWWLFLLTFSLLFFFVLKEPTKTPKTLPWLKEGGALLPLVLLWCSCWFGLFMSRRVKWLKLVSNSFFCLWSRIPFKSSQRDLSNSKFSSSGLDFGIVSSTNFRWSALVIFMKWFSISSYNFS